EGKQITGRRGLGCEIGTWYFPSRSEQEVLKHSREEVVWKKLQRKGFTPKKDKGKIRRSKKPLVLCAPEERHYDNSTH
ncbi:unnamed protein product, partial [Gulo gulo]